MHKFYINFLMVLAMFNFTTAQDVMLSITNYENTFGPTNVHISIVNTAEIGGFQFNLVDNPEYFDVLGAYAGLAEDAGFMMSVNEEGLVLGFSLTGTTIPAGEGVLTVVTVLETEENPFSVLSLENLIFSDADGFQLSSEVSNTYGIGDMVPLLTLHSPEDGDEIYGTTIDVSVSSDFTTDGDHYHAYLDGSMTGMYYSDEFSIEDVEFGSHTLTVVKA